MGHDRFVRWSEGDAPPAYAVFNYLVSFAKSEGIVGCELHWAAPMNVQSRIFLRLAGLFEQHGETRERWFEVFCAPDHVDVITREMDRETSDLADKFARAVAEMWDGTLEE